ncbi:cob(I)yrinic acid a,c-diamide adenosyltransferase [Vibrio mangrovi]|uniref:Cob(I)yrinic acid a,c-diamide adenosyltransferase n=1 Tax=Vibrio mangrovi TaxID=474394 RepID=A0A1Y6IY64_9VIBR|nr:cob(I)yrinic acid a,c-diamide adenosyltransferase [Vibrio mangrovi]MDW6005175.1 cob(I)yrinic acid a,c-diamide adenosyltransferase [Vibrio mangrovi]SMS02615.1 Cob(I)yrinic acid a,c-diamide adenosyltransferase [Vibrio mangrovi]
MGIYTKTGDKGTTALVSGVRVAKTDIQVEAYGTIDELNTHISVAQKQATVPETIALLESIQYQLFFMGAELASPDVSIHADNQQQVTDSDIKALENAIDHAMARVPELHSFVLPGSSGAGSQLHLARAVARRAERRILTLNETKPVRGELMRYLNRLSDALYALARREDHEQQLQSVIAQVTTRYQAALLSKEDILSGEKLAENRQSKTTPQESTPKPQTSADATQAALKLLTLAVTEAQRIGIPIVFALVDKHGNAILSYRMPNALLVSHELAPKKAYTAVALKMATHELHALVQPGQDLYQLEASCAGEIVSFGGGFPIWIDGELAGGIGISGGTVEQDMQIAQAALQGI